MSLIKTITATTGLITCPCFNRLSVWYGEVTYENSAYESFWKMLDNKEQTHAQQLKNELNHKRYVFIHGYLRCLLAMTLQQTAHSLTIVKTAHGKPYLADYPELVFNLSHTNDIFVIALGWQCQLGIDIENHKDRSTFNALVKKCFAPEEALYWQRLPVEQQTAAFYRFWTRKEAFVKATGAGIALGLQNCVINPEKPNYFLRIPSQYGDISHWQIQDIDFCQKHSSGIYCALSTNKTMATLSVNTLPHYTSMTQ